LQSFFALQQKERKKVKAEKCPICQGPSDGFLTSVNGFLVEARSVPLG